MVFGASPGSYGWWCREILSLIGFRAVYLAAVNEPVLRLTGMNLYEFRGFVRFFDLC